MNRAQLQAYIIEPTLRAIPYGYTEEADKAIQMIIAHESHCGRYIKQVGNGPALGQIQMEPATHDCVWKEGDSIWVNALAIGIITQEEFTAHNHPPAWRLVYDLQYNVFMARQRLFMKPEALPKTSKELSSYLKKHWNTTKGKAGDSSYLNAWLQWD
jgi:hypothetical protein